MIRRLRQVHRVAFVLFALAVPVLMTRALALRPPKPLSSLPVPVAVGPGPGALAATWSTALGPIRYGFIAPPSAGQPASLQIAPTAALRAPDLLLYWTMRTGPVSTVDRDDRLLGRLNGGAAGSLTLPLAVMDTAGTLVLYSLGHQRVIATLPLPPVAGTRP
jgi:hypothetical protein